MYMQYLIVGLGNPGDEYQATRHNVGRMAVISLAESLGVLTWRIDKKKGTHIAQAETPNGNTLTLLLPDTYMNCSGNAITAHAFPWLCADRLILVHDDIDLPLGTLRIVCNRGAGGHNGVRSVERVMHTKDFVRVRIGVVPTTPAGVLKKPPTKEGVSDFLLRSLPKKELQTLVDCAKRAGEATRAVVDYGREKAMGMYNGTQKTSPIEE